jgi:hypothetical protein
LENEGHLVIDEEQKASLAFSFFDNILSFPPSHSAAINLDLLDMPRIDAAHLEDRFEAEVWGVIKSLSSDKEPGLGGFMARFFHVAWPVIKPDIMQAFDAFWWLDMRNL